MQRPKRNTVSPEIHSFYYIRGTWYYGLADYSLINIHWTPALSTPNGYFVSLSEPMLHHVHNIRGSI